MKLSKSDLLWLAHIVALVTAIAIVVNLAACTRASTPVPTMEIK